MRWKWMNPRNKRFCITLGFCLVLLLLISCLKPGVKLSPAEDHVQKGNAFLAAGEFEEAASMYHKALEYDPEFGEAYLGLGRVWVIKESPVRARLFLHKAIQLDEDLTAAYAYLGDIYYNQGDLKRAIENYIKCQPKDGVYPEIHFKLGKYYLQEEDLANAKAEFNLVMNHSEHWGAYWGLGRISREEGDLEKANEYLLTAYRKQKNPDTCLDLGLILAERGDPETAYLLLKQSLNSHNPHIIDINIDQFTEELKSEFISSKAESNANELDVNINLKSGERLEVAVYNLDADKIRMLFKGYLSRGNYNWSWDGKNDEGTPVPHGIYLANIDGESFIYTKKVDYMN